MLDRKSHEPLYIQLAAELKIYSRKLGLKKGNRLPSEHDLIKKYGVSRPIVRKAFDVLAKENFCETKPGKGSYLTGGKRDMVYHVVIASRYIFNNPNYTSVLHKLINGIIQVTNASNGDSVYYSFVSYTSAPELAEKMKHMQPEGMILVVPRSGDLDIISELKSEGMTVVVTNHNTADEKISCIYSNQYQMTLSVCRYVINQKKMDLYMVDDKFDTFDSKERYRAFKDALLQANIYNEKKMFSCNLKKKEDIEKLWKLISGRKTSTVYLMSRAASIYALLVYLNKNKLSLPATAHIVGFDDPDFFQIISPSLTSITQPMYEMGKRAAGIIIDNILEVRKKIYEEEFPCSIHFRESLDGRMYEKNASKT